ncbi:MAG: DUF4271 domain-containing protein [Microscillaceae bacterium]|nr:DUF4271 domain-containing protein [Microscillaceae bacterium]MDW8461363.1 DUF4271 domain-containing protein [Cytophagales bacterium]
MLNHIQKYFSFVFALWAMVLLMAQAKAQVQLLPENYFIISDLTESYQVYDEKYESYVPYIKRVYQNTQTISAWLPLHKNKPYTLLLYAYPKTYFFIDKKLVYKFDKEGWYFFSIDSLARIKNKSHLFLTFYHEDYRLPLPTLCIASKQTVTDKLAKKTKEPISLQILQRQKKVIRDVITSIFLLVLVVFTLVWIYYRKNFLRYYSLRSSRSVLIRNEILLMSKPFSLANLILVLFLSLVIGFVYVLIRQEKALSILQINNTYWADNIGFWWLFYLAISICIFALLIFKYVLNWFFANLLGLEKIVNIHYFEYIRLSYLFYPNFALFLILLYLSFPYRVTQIVPYMPYIFVSFYVLQIIFLLFYIYHSLNSKKLYIFYYLCITELTLFLMSIKILM